MRYLLLLGLLLVLSGCVMNDMPSADPSADGSVTVLASGLSVPWDVAALPEGGYLVTERPGRLVLVENGTVSEVASFDASARGESGLMGLELHPEFASNRLLYVYLTTDAGNEVRRYRYDDGLSAAEVVFSGIPAAPYHDGGRIRFGPDGYLWVTVGDATDEDLAQDPSTLHGSILRLHDDGSIPADNPYGAVWSYGHRNPQGLAWDGEVLYATEHGRSGVVSGMDEVNVVERGENYGWPVVEGDEEAEGMVGPLVHSGADVTWAPASAAVLDGTLYFGGLRGAAVYAMDLETNEVSRVLEGYGRIRTVREHDGRLLVTTSNTDGRGSPGEADDLLLVVDV